MKSKQKNTFLFILVLFSIIFIYEFTKQKDLSNNKVKTSGIISDYKSHYKNSYSIVYKYNINNKVYTGQVNVKPFTCRDGTKYCLGKEFTVYYSSKNPENSRIDLGRYEKYKNTVEFVK